jgi:hypothetical protein
MKKKIPTQLVVGLGILAIGSGIVGGEYLLVKWYPTHKANVISETLKLIPYKNDGLGIDMQVAAGIDQKVDISPGEVRIFSPRLFSTDPSITLTSQPNPDQSSEFTPQTLAIWETDGVTHSLPQYQFDHIQINGRDAVMIWQSVKRHMVLTTRIISPERIIEAKCTAGGGDVNLYMQACEDSVKTIKLAGAPSALTQGTEGAASNPIPLQH